jgi:CheY-like chemotaxis protein
MQCLLVDDDLDDQEIFLMTLEKINKNIKCLTANNGVEALSLLTQNSFVPDYIFLDVNMPKMNGIECLRSIKNI